MSRLSPGRGGGPLKSFRLRDVPEDIRIDAAVRHADELARALRSDSSGRHGGRSEGWTALTAAIMARRFAVNPSDTVYRIPLEAWDRVIGR